MRTVLHKRVYLFDNSNYHSDNQNRIMHIVCADGFRDGIWGIVLAIRMQMDSSEQL